MIEGQVSEAESPLQIRIPRSLRTRFKLVCTEQERSMSEVLREFIEWYTKRKEGAE